MKSKSLKIKERLTPLIQGDHLFVLCAMICSFLITMEASIVKAVSNSVFISTYGVQYLPYVWCAIVPFNYLIVNTYNHLIPRIGPFKMQLLSLSAAALISLMGALYLNRSPSLGFCLYIWKDIYILLAFQQLWSIIHSTVDVKRAKYLYGVFFGMGGLGSVMGSTVPSFFAIEFGSAHLLFATLPLYVLLATGYYYLLKTRKGLTHRNLNDFPSGRSNFKEGARLILHSPYLRYILLLVVLMQIIATLFDYNFNTVLYHSIPTIDARTQFLGRMFGIVNILNIALQFIGSFILVKLIGIQRSHFLIPLILIGMTSFAMALPLFGVIAFSFATVKCFDYSLFGILREMLYTPLSSEEKFGAKSVIDVFAYRSSKALASLLIIGFQSFLGTRPLETVLAAILLLCVIWALSIPQLFKYQKTI